MSTSEIATVLAWHDALNDSDIDTLLALSSDDVEIGDHTGASQGLTTLREWATTSGLTLNPGRMFVHHGVVVVEEQATAEGQTTTGAVAFRVVDDQVTSVFRHESLESAFSATDLSEKDAVS
ncbi:nuclear transport factor 2 family protein [Rhodococcus spelaei]|uniref:Nuclear transport factor 2 family protein n=1 Tax=Rhodococcus spelaei TaxID=2546320 RepID=A0A541BS88_9NOCA|nr:nuclear transport factor 2 family protein [Rhodococcus spelaei]TQF75184.1 nuclear transport factor 2 family protein [Rhodococcus spelaei]